MHNGHLDKKFVFTKKITGIGDFSIRPFKLSSDCKIIHTWVNKEYAKYWQMQDTSLEYVENTYTRIIEENGTEVFMGYYGNNPSFLMEKYHPNETSLKNHYSVNPSDRGMHILVGPPKKRIPSFTWYVFTTIMDFLFSEEGVDRIVVEPDVRNEKIQVLNRKVGFVNYKRIHLKEKEAFLAFCTKDQYVEALKNNHS